MASSAREREVSKPNTELAIPTDKIKNSTVLILGGTGRVGGSTAVALSKLSPHLQIHVGGRNRWILFLCHLNWVFLMISFLLNFNVQWMICDREKGAETVEKLGKKSKFVEVDINNLDALEAALKGLFFCVDLSTR